MPEPRPDPASGDLTDLANWWGRTALPISAAGLARRASRVARLKRILPLVGIVAVAAALLWPLLKPDLPTSDWQPPAGSQNAGKSTMLDLAYRGTNQQGEPFTVNADKAVRNLPLGADPAKAGIPPVIDLSTPHATMQNTDGSGVALDAQSGVYDEQAQGLNLNGDVKVNRSDGLVVNAPELSVDFGQQRAWTDQPTTATGPFGQIAGQGLRLEDGGKTIIFTGQTRATLNGAPNPSAPDQR